MLKILIADLEPIQRKTMKLVIEKQIQKKVVIFEVDNGEQVLKLIEKNNFDIVILNTRLISVCGVECAKKIKEMKPAQKIIMLTMYDDKVKETLAHIGIDQFIVKPIRPNHLFEIIRKELEKSNEGKRKRANDKVASIVKFIDEHIHEDITLSYVAEKTNLSVYYLSKVFKKEIGVNFITYVTERKMTIAKELLRNNEIPIINIAFQLGYTEPSYFTKVFKKSENMTPSQYRSQHTIWN